MDPAVGAAIIAGLFALAVAGLGLIRPSGDVAWYRRWIEIRKDATDDIQTQVADAQVRRYVLGFFIADRTRKARRRQYVAGAVLIAFSALLLFLWINADSTAGQWVYGGLAAVAYVGGIVAIGTLPAGARRKAADELEHLLADLATDAGTAPRTLPGTEPTPGDGDKLSP